MSDNKNEEVKPQESTSDESKGDAQNDTTEETPAIDPNVHAEHLANLSLNMAQHTHVSAASLRNEDVTTVRFGSGHDPNEIARRLAVDFAHALTAPPEPEVVPTQSDDEKQRYQQSGAVEPTRRLTPELQALQDVLKGIHDIQQLHDNGNDEQDNEQNVLHVESDTKENSAEENVKADGDAQQDNTQTDSQGDAKTDSQTDSKTESKSEEPLYDDLQKALKDVYDVQKNQQNEQKQLSPEEEQKLQMKALEDALKDLEQQRASMQPFQESTKTEPAQQEQPQQEQEQHNEPAQQEQQEQHNEPAQQEQPQEQHNEPAVQEQPQEQHNEPAQQEQPQEQHNEPAQQEQPQEQHNEPAQQEQPQEQHNEPAQQEQPQKQHNEPAQQEQPQEQHNEPAQQEQQHEPAQQEQPQEQHNESAQQEQHNEPAQQEQPQEEDDNDDNDDNDDSPKVIIKGAKFGSNKPKKEDARTQDVIIAKHVDKNRDKDVGVEISKYNLNYVFSEPDDRDHKFSVIFGNIDSNYLPSYTDLREKWGDILDQLDLGSCVSNSVSYCVRFCYKKQKLGEFTPSRLFIYYNGRLDAGYPLDEDTGLTIRDGYKSVAHYSVCSEDNWPYVPDKYTTRPPETCYNAAKEHKTFRYINLDNDEAQLKKSLKDGFPISFGAALFESFMSREVARSGLVPIPDIENERRCGGHAMTIIGHDDDSRTFLVANNWGSTWGDGGYCWMPYEYILNDDLCGDFWSIRYWS